MNNDHLERIKLELDTYGDGMVHIDDAVAQMQKIFEDALAEDRRKAELWDAFCSNGRIRTIGWAKLGELGYQHLGFEIWTMYGTPEDDYDFTEENATAIKNIETYLDAWILTNKGSE